MQGQPGRCNVYLIEDEGGVTLFDAGARTMARAVAQRRREARRHPPRSCSATATPTIAAPRRALGAPVLCHPAEVAGRRRQRRLSLLARGPRGLPSRAAPAAQLMHRFAWDGGPVKIAGTLAEGDEVAGFSVVEIPGHAPGQIALWRESDRLALSSDCFYTLDMWGRDCEPHLPLAVYNYDTEQARASMRKLAALEPAAAWPGHAKPLTGDVRSQLERAAER